MFYHPAKFKDDFENYISSWLCICEEIRKRAETSLKLFDMIFCLTEISATPIVHLELVTTLPYFRLINSSSHIHMSPALLYHKDTG